MSEDEIHKALYAHLDEAKHPALKMFDVDCVYDICRRLLASGQFISVKELREKIEKELRVLITHEVSNCNRCRSYNNALDDFRVLLDEMSKLPKSREKIGT